MHARFPASLLPTALLLAPVWAGQAPGGISDADVPLSHRDRVYVAEQFSNTVSVTDPASNALLGVIRLGDPQPGNLSPLYRGQVLVHGMGFSPDHKRLAVVSIGTNSVTFIDTATNTVKHVTYVGRAPHEAFFTPDGEEVWVSVRGEDYVAVLDSHTFLEKLRIRFRPDLACRFFHLTGNMDMCARRSILRPTSLPSPTIALSVKSCRQVPSAPTSRRRRTESKSGLHSRMSARLKCSTPARLSRC